MTILYRSRISVYSMFLDSIMQKHSSKMFKQLFRTRFYWVSEPVRDIIRMKSGPPAMSIWTD